MIVITGAAGFIGSAMVAYLNEKKVMDAILIDRFDTPFRFKNLSWKHYGQTIERECLRDELEKIRGSVDAIIHLGAKAGYIHEHWEQEKKDFLDLHQWLWNYCVKQDIPYIYASTGAVYGDGTKGFRDDEDTTYKLDNLHPYAQIRLEADLWSLEQKIQPPFWAALRMSNVYGPNEYHKMSNASLVYKAYNEILSYHTMRLFASDHPDFMDGGMTRDYIYVKDVVKMIYFLLECRPSSGIYNLSTSQERSFKNVCDLVFRELMIPARYEFEPILDSLKGRFPYKVSIPNEKLMKAGYEQPIMTLEEGVEDYIQKYLSRGEFY